MEQYLSPDILHGWVSRVTNQRFNREKIAKNPD